ncbi:protein kinase [Accumulibacter sp.]|uniref:protein kinase domain-containing protein n=1 Tax=Accumulibacter sp. TaxID=2053492 RepID=UPI0035B4A0D4
MSDTLAQEQPRSFQPPSKGEAVLVDGHYYFIGDQIGQGGFGAVYECSDEWSNQLVAKILLPKNRTYEEVRESWLEELQKLLALRHPNITYVHAAFEYKDTFYIVIERCFSTLDGLINFQGLSGELWVPYVARDILQGLAYIHMNNYVHKDIHPGNVFVSQSFDRMVPTRDPVWSFKIGDLGISRLESDIEIFNTLLAQWMLPPEAIDPSEFGPVGRSMDIYHTGLLLLALLLGKTPMFTREEILAGVPRQLAEDHPSKYGPAISRALRRHATARTPTALQFWRDIASVA